MQQQAGEDTDEQTDGGDHERDASVLGVVPPEGEPVVGETGTAELSGSEGLRGTSTRDGVVIVDGIA
jgi:hypothetical protein